MKIKDLCRDAHKMACDKGFWKCEHCGGSGLVSTQSNGLWRSENVCPNCLGSGKTKRNLSELLMLIVSELGEACEALRNDYRQQLMRVVEYGEGLSDDLEVSNIREATWKKDTFEDELADAVIRICDLAESQGIDLEWQITQKMKYNYTRPAKHGKKF